MSKLAITGTYLEENTKLYSALPGRGPWRIVAECPALNHNTLRAGQRGSRRSEKCVCPRARALVAEDLKRSNDARLQRQAAAKLASKPCEKRPGGKTGVAILSSVSAPFYMRNVVHGQGKAMPDLRAGSCRTPVGIAIIDQAHRRRDAAKALCSDCPVLEACFAWITSGAESPPGSWGGFYAGMGVTQRRRFALQKINAQKENQG